MAPSTGLDELAFRRILRRNITLPLVVGGVTAAIFIGLVLYLLSANSWIEHSERVIGNTQEIGRLVWRKEAALRGYAMTGEERYVRDYDLARPILMADVDALATLVRDNAAQVERMQRIKAWQQQWDRKADELIALRRRGDNTQAAVLAGRGEAERDATNRELDAFLGIEQTLRLNRADSGSQFALVTIIGSVVASVLLSFIVAWRGRKDLVQLSDAYSGSLDAHESQAAVLTHQAWLRDGQVRFGAQVVGQDSLARLAPVVLEFLAGYLGAAAGTLYVLVGRNTLERRGAIGRAGAENGADMLPQRILVSETLVGRAVTAAQPQHIDEVPADYWTVSSALGASPPKSLIVAPIRANGVVIGAMELAFMAPPDARSKEFLTLMSATIGDVVAAAQQQERLQEALEETQQLNEELQSQQEELRVANEQLEQQTSALSQSRAVLANQKAELEQTNEQLSAQARVLDEKNEVLTRVQQTLEEKAADLERASQYKSEFLANMSHELRTPLNSSLILSKLLADNKGGNLTGEQVRYAQTIHSAGNDLLVLINDILDLAKVEAGKVELVIDTVALEQLNGNLVRTFEPLARQKRLTFQCAVAPDVPPTITTDGHRLEQVLKNLLSNAVKFTEHGEVSVQWTMAGPDRVRCAVLDTGIGIAPSQHARVFEAFHQADGTTSRQYGGTGLGLSISRSLAELLGGEIALESTPGRGSVFSVTLPLHYVAPAGADADAGADAAAAAGHDRGAVAVSERVETAPVTAAPAVPAVSVTAQPSAVAASRTTQAQKMAQTMAQANEADAAAIAEARTIIPDDRHALSGERLVLVIEDEPQFAQILLDIAHDMQYQCIVCGTGGEGFAMAREYQPQAILLDLGLPDRSGLMVLQELKSEPRTRHIPVHVVSATDRADTALHLGAVGFAVKPTSRDDLANIFRRLQEKIARQVKRVLLVEDDARQRDSVVKLIGDEKIEIVAVETGEQALQRLLTEVFDCMIVDLKLPDMQGSELLRSMATTEACSFPPVIVYTGRNLSPAEERELLKYSQSIIIKGARSPERLLDEVTLFLHQVESDLPEDRRHMLLAARSRSRELEGRRVLVVDDDVRNVFSLTSALEHQGMRVEIGRNGHEALDILARTPDVDIVLMDVMMPGMDGLEAMRRIRSDLKLKSLPIIAVTAKAMQKDRLECLAAGASDYIAKPVDLDQLYSLLRVWVPKAMI
ncbi:response regulator [Cupriavidus plantarum]|uniref:response regulator n=1 Tax=Cupriavidus plantarum TaxID=942865 RepID=UPI000E27907C|nr:response regulator [Cupriavidus plantarum]REE92210.1 signal transduction histidine kinase [Cupriavidus plantarum]